MQMHVVILVTGLVWLTSQTAVAQPGPYSINGGHPVTHLHQDLSSYGKPTIALDDVICMVISLGEVSTTSDKL
jgi:hypothetical protein